MCGDHQRDPLHYGTLKHIPYFTDLFTAKPKQQDTAVRHFLSFHQRNLTGKAWLTATDIALGLVVAEGRRQAWDIPVAAGPGALHAVTPGEAGAAAALPDVLLALGTRIACGEP